MKLYIVFIITMKMIQISSISLKFSKSRYCIVFSTIVIIRKITKIWITLNWFADVQKILMIFQWHVKSNFRIMRLISMTLLTFILPLHLNTIFFHATFFQILCIVFVILQCVLNSSTDKDIYENKYSFDFQKHIIQPNYFV